MKLLIRAAAQRELQDGAEWYESKVPGLGLEFTLAIKAKFALIQRSPKLFQEAEHGTRRAVVSRFPYTVFYRLILTRLLF